MKKSLILSIVIMSLSTSIFASPNIPWDVRKLLVKAAIIDGLERHNEIEIEKSGFEGDVLSHGDFELETSTSMSVSETFNALWNYVWEDDSFNYSDNKSISFFVFDKEGEKVKIECNLALTRRNSRTNPIEGTVAKDGYIYGARLRQCYRQTGGVKSIFEGASASFHVPSAARFSANTYKVSPDMLGGIAVNLGVEHVLDTARDESDQYAEDYDHWNVDATASNQ